MTADAVQQCVKDRKEWRALVHIQLNEFQRPFLLGPVFFFSALPFSGGYHLERGGMPLHNAVRMNCKNGITTENQGADVKYMG